MKKIRCLKFHIGLLKLSPVLMKLRMRKLLICAEKAALRQQEALAQENGSRPALQE